MQINADKLIEKILKYQSIHDNYCKNISKGDVWKGHTTDHYDLSSGKATACDVILGFINELQAESEEQEPCENVMVANENLCDSCTTKGCIFQSGIVRNHCDFYKAESEKS